MLYIYINKQTNKNNVMKTSIYNEDKGRNATATELARAIMNAAVTTAIESTIGDFELDASNCGNGLSELSEEQREAVLEAMNKIAGTLWPSTSADSIDYHF